MSKILSVVPYTNPLLRRPSVKVLNIDSVLLSFIDDMVDTMFFSNGIGLAAPQVAKLINLMIVSDEKRNVIKMINPSIKNKKGSIVIREGCLSIPGIYIPVSRPKSVEVNYLDENGVEKTEKFDGMVSRVIQHELDHLSGKLMIDFLDPDKKKFLLDNMHFASKSFSL